MTAASEVGTVADHDPDALPATLPDVRAAALAALPNAVRDFLEGGAGDETTLRRNGEAFERWQLLPRVMGGRPTPSTRTEFMGMRLELPVLTAPFGADALFHPNGQIAVARANAASGVRSIVPEAGSFALEDVAAAAPGAVGLAQLHPMGPPENFAHMLTRIERAGYRGVCVTLDCPTGGWRERMMRAPIDFGSRIIAGNYAEPGAVDPREVFGQLFDHTETAVWDWDRLATLMSRSPLPWLAKGILTAHDAECAINAGASAILVSNHGGRQLDGAPTALEQLPEIADAAGGRVQIALDSGIRRGTDIVKAVALGADVVVLGRLAVYGLAAAGEAGVRQVHRLLRDELTTVLTLLGRGGVRELGRDAVREARW